MEPDNGRLRRRLLQAEQIIEVKKMTRHLFMYLICEILHYRSEESIISQTPQKGSGQPAPTGSAEHVHPYALLPDALTCNYLSVPE